MIIPFFIPHFGCPHQCVFCNQKNITGQTTPIDPSLIPQTVSDYLKADKNNKPVQIAFYGGSFTALPQETQIAYLESVRPFIRSGRIECIRLSTRPDAITSDCLFLLKSHTVKIVELGVQSLNDSVLTRAGRGHTTADSITAVNLLKEHGFTIGLQLMLGLPGDSAEIFADTVNRVIELKPDFVRIYPTLVIKGTPLEELYRAGQYAPLSLEDAVSICRGALVRFEKTGIRVIRIGLQPTKELEKQGIILAGPYHPAFRELVVSSLFLDRMRSVLHVRIEKTDRVTFQVNPADMSAAIGQQRSNIRILKKEFGLQEIRIKAGHNILRKGRPMLILSNLENRIAKSPTEIKMIPDKPE